MLRHDVIMTSYCCQQYAECLVTTLFQQNSAPAHCASHMQQLNCCVKKRQTLLPPNSPDLCPVDYEIWAVMQHHVYHRQIYSIVWMNWNGGSSTSGAVLNSRFLTRLLTSGEDNIERVFLLKEVIWSTACELTMLILSISVSFHVTCLTVASLITKSCQQRWPIHSCSFYKVVH